MKKRAIGVLCGVLATAAAAPALAASPRQFKAQGDFQTVTGGAAQDVHLTISYKNGHVRIVTHSKDSGTSVILATKGQDDIAMLDPAQKIVLHLKPSMLKTAGGADSAELGSYQNLLDPAGIKTLLQEHGHKVGPGPTLCGHSTTLYEADRKGNSMRVWFADDVSLPLKIEGHSSKGSHFGVTITHLSLHPSFGAHDFDEVPPGYQDIRAEAVH